MHQPIEKFGELNSMMTWAETAAKKEGISREEADKWAMRSHQRAIVAIDSGKFKEEIVPVPVRKKHGEVIFDTDETPRRDTSLEKLANIPIPISCASRWGAEHSEHQGELILAYGDNYLRRSLISPKNLLDTRKNI